MLLSGRELMSLTPSTRKGGRGAGGTEEESLSQTVNFDDYILFGKDTGRLPFSGQNFRLLLVPTQSPESTFE